MDVELKAVDLSELIKEASNANAMLQQRFGVQVEMIGMDATVPFNTDDLFAIVHEVQCLEGVSWALRLSNVCESLKNK